MNQERKKRLSQLEESVVTTDFNKEEIHSDAYDLNKENHIISLDSVLNDPGKRFLFKSHLDKEMCSEKLLSSIVISKTLKRCLI